MTEATGGVWEHIRHVCPTAETVARRVQDRLPLALRHMATPVAIALSPLYWVYPALLADYVRSIPREEALEDVVRFAVWRIAHRTLEDPDVNGLGDLEKLDEFDSARESVRAAYSINERVPGSESDDGIEARVMRKCSPWLVVLKCGTARLEVASIGMFALEYSNAWRASLAVFYCLQFVDDWHDIDEDLRRGIWNMWTAENWDSCILAMLAGIPGAIGAIELLRPSTLREVLAVQLRDTLGEYSRLLGEITSRRAPPKA